MKKVVSFFILLCFILLSSSSVHAEKVNAGVLPYCYDQSGQAYFLLGQEPNGEWADFGGNAEKKDKNPLETAAREFSEETRNVFGKFAKGLRGTELEKKVSEEEYKQASIEYIKPRIERIKTELTHPKGYYKMYLAEVDYIPEHSFNKAAKVKHYEKTEYEWISVDRFMERVREITNRFKAYYGKKKKRQIRRQIFDIFKAEDKTIMKTIYPELDQKEVKLDGEKSKGKEKGEYLPYLFTQ